jgi:CheY-like chemotaxis protein
VYAGYAVEVAEDGAAALESARGQTPDLVVLDVMLPGLNGLEVCRWLDLGRRLPPAPARDEVGRLTAAFNTMLRQLQEAHQHLAEALDSH